MNLKQEISDELAGLTEDVKSYFEAGIPLKNHEHDILLKLESSKQVILQMFEDAKGPNPVDSVDTSHVMPPAQNGN